MNLFEFYNSITNTVNPTSTFCNAAVLFLFYFFFLRLCSHSFWTCWVNFETSYYRQNDRFLFSILLLLFCVQRTFFVVPFIPVFPICSFYYWVNSVHIYLPTISSDKYNPVMADINSCHHLFGRRLTRTESTTYYTYSLYLFFSLLASIIRFIFSMDFLLFNWMFAEKDVTLFKLLTFKSKCRFICYNIYIYIYTFCVDFFHRFTFFNDITQVAVFR